MPRPDTSEVTQEEVEALFGTDGEPQEESEAVEENSSEESEEAEPVEEEEQPEAEEEESEEESEEEDAEEAEESEEESEELDWSELPTEYQKAYEAVEKEAQKWKRDYGKLQSEFTKRGQAQREEEKTLTAMRSKAEVADQWNALLDQYPHLQQVIERELAKIRNPLDAIEIPPELEGDPAMQFVKKTYEPVIRQLEQKLSQYEQKLGKIDLIESRERQAQSEAKLNGLLKDAGEKYKQMFGKDPTDADIREVLQYMVDNKYYSSGKIAAMEVFADKYEKSLASRQASYLRDKAKKNPPKSKTVNPGRVARGQRHATTPEEAIAMAMAEQGFGT